MARIEPSALVVSVSGKAGGIVFSRWKGRKYVRSLVTPTFTETEGQVAQRNRLKFWVDSWHRLEAQLKTYIGTLAEAVQLSGFNSFCARNIKDGYDAVNERIVPLNTLQQPLGSFAFDEAVGKDLHFTITQGEAANGDWIYALAAEMTGSAVTGPVFLADKDSQHPHEPIIITAMPKYTQKYRVWVMVEKAAGGEFSVALRDDATTGEEL